MSTSTPSDHPALRDACVVVVGAGGLGCPAVWALAEAGVGRLVLVDPDRVEPSNLPRQVLYREEDVGRPKAVVAAERLAEAVGRVESHHARLDDRTEATLLAGADVLVDATDGAPTKDWLNAVAVRRGIPLVHAAAVRSEGRLLEVPAGGRPCLACLFGRLREEPGGTCADLGVWGGVVGAVGFLAADAALRRLRAPDAPSPGYVVVDVEGGRAFPLGAARDPACPVCGDAARLGAEPYPEDVACEVAAEAGPAEARDVLDLVEEVCPLNLLRARRELERLPPGATLEIHLGAEGAASVPDGLRALGHDVVEAAPGDDGAGARASLRLVVRRAATARTDAPLSRDALVRYARQVVLPEVGEAGQRRLLEGFVAVSGGGPAAETAARYLEAAGVGAVPRRAAGSTTRLEVGRADPIPLGLAGDAAGRVGVLSGALEEDAAGIEDALPPPVARALGALLADAACRLLVAGGAPAAGKAGGPGIVLGADGTIATRSPTASTP